MRVWVLMLALWAFGASTAQAETNAAAGGDTSREQVDKELLYQIRFGQLSNVQLLMRKGADPSQLNEIGWPLVAIAASRRDGQAVPLLRELIKAGADINQGGPSNMYPVIIAARSGDDDLMHFLLYEALADIDKKDLNGATARDIAADGGYDRIVAEMDGIMNQRAAARKAMVTPERRDALVREIIYDSCAIEYLHYYYDSKQDPSTPQQAEAAIDAWKGKLSLATNDLVQIFHYPYDTLVKLSKKGAKYIYDDMDALISNRNRRAHGIGAEGNLEKRCGIIADNIVDDNAAAAGERARRKAARVRRTM